MKKQYILSSNAVLSELSFTERALPENVICRSAGIEASTNTDDELAENASIDTEEGWTP